MNERTFPELGLEAGVNAFDKVLPSPFVVPSFVFKTTFTCLRNYQSCSGSLNLPLWFLSLSFSCFWVHFRILIQKCVQMIINISGHLICLWFHLIDGKNKPPTLSTSIPALPGFLSGGLCIYDFWMLKMFICSSILVYVCEPSWSVFCLLWTFCLFFVFLLKLAWRKRCQIFFIRNLSPDFF